MATTTAEIPSELRGRIARLLGYFAEIGLTDRALGIAHQVVYEILDQRRAMTEDRARYEEITREVIERPIFVTGLARSGTTLLHSIVGADPNNRVPARWEVARPSPPPGLGVGIEERRAIMDREIADIVQRDPTLLQSHPYYDQGGNVSADCELIGMLDFHFVRRTMGYYARIPAFLNIELIDDDVAFFRSHRRVLQALQWRRPRKRWALKGTEHFVRLRALKTVYPDACVIWIHRDPQRSLASIMTLMSNLAEGMSSEPVDRLAIGRRVLDRQTQLLDAAIKDEFARHPDVHHMRYADFATDPVRAVQSAYQSFDVPFDAATAESIRSWLTDPSHAGDRYGKFRYSLAEFGVSPDEIETRVRDYREAFDVPVERSGA